MHRHTREKVLHSEGLQQYFQEPIPVFDRTVMSTVILNNWDCFQVSHQKHKRSYLKYPVSDARQKANSKHLPMRMDG